MPEKNRFPAVLQPVEAWDIKGGLAPHGSMVGRDSAYPLKATDHKDPHQVVSVALRGRDGGATAELGGEAAYALRAANGGGSDPYVLAPVIPIDMRQASRGATMTNKRPEGSSGGAPGTGVGQPGDPSPTLSGSHMPAIAFSCKDYGGDAAYALRAAAGGGSDPYVLAPIPILEAGARTGTSTTDIRAGMGVGQPGDPMFTLQSGKQHAVCVTGEITHTLKADGFDASEDGTGRGQPIVAFDTYNQSTSDVTQTLCSRGDSPGGNVHLVPAVLQQMAVRRLMPIECHYLQGFPGDWCAVPTGPKGDRIAADGPQYKQLGNSWAVNHARWVGYRIAAWLAANPPRSVIEMEFDENLLMWALAA